MRVNLLPRLLPKAQRNEGRLAATLITRCLYKETGAGEGIRTLDPNLGKVVLYP